MTQLIDILDMPTYREIKEDCRQIVNETVKDKCICALNEVDITEMKKKRQNKKTPAKCQ